MGFKDKIKKLLRLAQSPNENEARAAMLKAREMMAQHKLSEEECAEVLKQKVLQLKTGVTCTKRIDPWMICLAGVIAEAYRCENCVQSKYHSKTYEIVFVGFEEDAELCDEVFKFAVNCIHDNTKEIESKIREMFPGYKVADVIRDRKNSYGYGFAAGLKYAFDLQNESKKQEWGLVLVTPKEVKDVVSGFKNTEFTTQYSDGSKIYASDYVNGESDGRQFSTRSTLRGASEAI